MEICRVSAEFLFKLSTNLISVLNSSQFCLNNLLSLTFKYHFPNLKINLTPSNHLLLVMFHRASLPTSYWFGINLCKF